MARKMLIGGAKISSNSLKEIENFSKNFGPKIENLQFSDQNTKRFSKREP